MSEKYLEMPAGELQAVVNTVESQVGVVPFHTLCVLVAETRQCREYNFSPGQVRVRVTNDDIVTMSRRPPSIRLKTMKDRLAAGRPFCVSYGAGVDSTAMLIHLARMYDGGRRPEFRPDLITFADTGNEKRGTYAYLPVMNAFLKRNGFPQVETVVYRPKRTKNGMYTTLEENCLVNRTLPSLAFGYKKCSLKWKRGPQDRRRAKLPACRQAWEDGLSVIVAIGYDDGPKDSCRSWDITDDDRYEYIYPLIEIGWDRDRCIAEIRKEGLAGFETDAGGAWLESGGVPLKSACWFCPSLQPEEVLAYADTEEGRGYLRGIVRMEANARPKLKKIEGLWRNGVKGTRGGKAKPGSVSKFIADNRLLEGRLPLPVVG